MIKEKNFNLLIWVIFDNEGQMKKLISLLLFCLLTLSSLGFQGDNNFYLEEETCEASFEMSLEGNTEFHIEESEIPELSCSKSPQPINLYTHNKILANELALEVFPNSLQKISFKANLSLAPPLA